MWSAKLDRDTRGVARADILALAAYAGLAAVLTFPLVLHLSSTVPHDLGDPLLSATILWWNGHVTPLTSRWWDGFSFFPAHGTLAFSDHRLGASLIASPLEWLGLTPIAVYNITLLATFPLSAIGAYWLGFTLTGRRDAALLCGLAFGFAPYRIAHIEHLELLTPFGMAPALASLHKLRDTGERRWLAVFAAALVLQGLCSSYYLIFFSVFLVLWVAWFVDWREWRLAAGLAAAAACAALALLPIAIPYARVMTAYGLSRPYGEVLYFSADLSSFVTASPLVALWGWTSHLNHPEIQLFPGLTVVALALVGASAAWARHRAPGPGRATRVLPVVFASIAYVALAAGLAAQWIGPWRIHAGPLTISADVIFKPISVALVAIVAAVATSPPGRAAWRSRSPLAFYLAATAALFLCALGPRPTFLGERILYQPPYAWLMHLPLFADGVRVPARFAMPAMLALAAAGSLAFANLVPSRRRAIVALLAVGMIADTWVTGLPFAPVPEVWRPSLVRGFDAVLELPLGNTDRDTAAMYRATRHGKPTVNGYSGYEPLHYSALRIALDGSDAAALDAVAEGHPLLIAVDTRADEDGRWRALVARHAGVVARGNDGPWAFFGLTPATPPRVACDGAPLPIVAAMDGHGPVAVSPLVDRDWRTDWITRGPQHAGDALTLDLGASSIPACVALSLGRFVDQYPRALEVDTSVDGLTWMPAFRGNGAAMTVAAALRHPSEVTFDVGFEPRQARFIRLRATHSEKFYPWLVGGVVVRGRDVTTAAE